MQYPIKDGKGFTLVEIMVALIILSIIIAAFAPMLSNSYSTIFSTGRQSNTLYELQQTVENEIANYNNSGTEILQLNFPGLPLNTIGKKITVSKEYTENNGQKRTIIVNTFVSNINN